MPNKFSRNWDDLYTKAEQKPAFDRDERRYSPKFSKDGTFNALIRFLPAPVDEAPYSNVFDHSFKGEGGYYSEKCPTTIGGKCPVCDINSEAWKAGNEALARTRARLGGGVANILVIADPQEPKNDGKVFIYRFGKEILNKIKATTRPPEDKIKIGIKPIQIFDYYTGANFRLCGKKQINNSGKQQNDYSESSFGDVGPVGDDAFIEKIEAQLYSLKEFTDPTSFKSYEELDAKLQLVLKSGRGPSSGAKAAEPTQNAPQGQNAGSSAPQTGPVTQGNSVADKVNTVAAQTPSEPPVVEYEKVDDATFFANIKAQQKR